MFLHQDPHHRQAKPGAPLIPGSGEEALKDPGQVRLADARARVGDLHKDSRGGFLPGA